jgi:TDG/mug DNA glycosylase family protein
MELTSLPFDGAVLPDILIPGLKIVFCGINPGLLAANAGHHFRGRGNRFWQTVYRAGFTPHQLIPQQDTELLKYGYGLTTAVARPTARAIDLAPEEFDHASVLLRGKIEQFAPCSIAFLGKAAYAAIVKDKNVAWGRQQQKFGGAQVWVLPNPSGRNRAFSLDALVRSYSEMRLAIARLQTD